jgi:hypothetical protein
LSDILEEPSEISLPFDTNKQIAILGHLVKNDQFFSQCYTRIDPAWFQDPYATKIYAAKVKWFTEFNRSPTIEELRNVPQFLIEDQRSRNRINDMINSLNAFRDMYKLDALRPELTAWMHSQYFEVGLRKSYQYYKKKETSQAYAAVDEMVNNIKTTRFEEDNEERFTNYMQEIEENRIEYSNALTTGLTLFDHLLTPKAQKGSLLPGDMSIIMAPVNVGKTTAMITTVVHNVAAGKSVLFLTHEGRPEDIKEKIRCSFLGVTPLELLDLYKTPEGRARLDYVAKWMNQFLTYYPYNKPGLTVEEVATVIRRKQEERVAKRGKGYDLLVDDYPAKLTTQQAARGMQKRERDEIVYNYFEQIGLQYKMHVLCAIQTNREGSKVNKGQREDRLLTMEDVQESWGPMTCATNVWTINRSPHDKVFNRLTYYIDKSRSSETGFAVVCKTDYARSRTHGNDLGATYYRSASTYADKLDQYLDQYIGQEMPDHLLLT